MSWSWWRQCTRITRGPTWKHQDRHLQAMQNGFYTQIQPLSIPLQLGMEHHFASSSWLYIMIQTTHNRSTDIPLWGMWKPYVNKCELAKAWHEIKYCHLSIKYTEINIFLNQICNLFFNYLIWLYNARSLKLNDELSSIFSSSLKINVTSPNDRYESFFKHC